MTIAGNLLLLTLTSLLNQPLPPTEARSLSAASPRDVVINEIAWMGTAASTADEWLELYNTTASPVDIGNWSIYGADTGVCLNFSAADGSTTTTVYAADIKERGFRVVSLGSELQGHDALGLAQVAPATIEAAADQAGKLLSNAGLRQEPVKYNFRLGQQFYSIDALRGYLEPLVSPTPVSSQ